MITANQFQQLLDQLKSLCQFQADSERFAYRDKVFSVAFHEAERRAWIEVSMDLIPLEEGNAVEMMATALASNSNILNAVPVPTYFGMKDSPARLVVMLRVEGQTPTPQELIQVLEQLPVL
jgi:hypothetical protein